MSKKPTLIERLEELRGVDMQFKCIAAAPAWLESLDRDEIIKAVNGSRSGGYHNLQAQLIADAVLAYIAQRVGVGQSMSDGAVKSPGDCICGHSEREHSWESRASSHALEAALAASGTAAE